MNAEVGPRTQEIEKERVLFAPREPGLARWRLETEESPPPAFGHPQPRQTDEARVEPEPDIHPAASRSDAPQRRCRKGKWSSGKLAFDPISNKRDRAASREDAVCGSEENAEEGDLDD
jgi:hypothetical protein